MSINRVIISGNLTRDPELRSTASGLPVLGFGVAVNDRRKNQQTGEWEDYPNFIDCTMFGARAESLSRYLGKGTKVAIEGKLRWSQWEREGQKRSKIEVIADRDGLLKVDREKLKKVNAFGEMMIATRHGNTVVKKGDKLAGTRIIPLVIKKEKMQEAEKICAGIPILNILPFSVRKAAIITTGNEVYHGRIKDAFTPVIE